MEHFASKYGYVASRGDAMVLHMVDMANAAVALCGSTFLAMMDIPTPITATSMMATGQKCCLYCHQAKVAQS